MSGGLAACRAEIDAIDAELVALVAKRMRVVDRVVALKREAGLPARIEARVEEVAQTVRARAEAEGVPPDLAENVWRALMEAVIAYEEERLAG